VFSRPLRETMRNRQHWDMTQQAMRQPKPQCCENSSDKLKVNGTTCADALMQLKLEERIDGREKVVALRPDGMGRRAGQPGVRVLCIFVRKYTLVYEFIVLVLFFCITESGWMTIYK